VDAATLCRDVNNILIFLEKANELPPFPPAPKSWKARREPLLMPPYRRGKKRMNDQRKKLSLCCGIHASAKGKRDSGMPVGMRQTEDPDYNEVNSNHIVQDSWKHKDQNAGDQSRQGLMRYVRQVHQATPVKILLIRYLSL
jgi:hypothetical protein